MINLKFGKPLVVTVLFAFLFFILINGYFVLDKATGLPVPQQNLTLEIEFKRQVGTTSKLNIDDIYGQINSKSSLPLQSKPVEFGTHYTYYLLKLKNLSNKKGLYTALIDNPSLDQLEVFELTNLNNPILAFNPNLEFENLTLRALPHFEIGLRANEEKQYILISQTNGSPNFPVNIFRSQDFDQYKNTVLMLWGGFITVVIVMGIYNLVLYFGNRETVYLLYIAYITLFLIVLSVLHGYGLYLFPVSIWQLLNEKIMFFYYWLGISLTLFTLYFFRLQDNRSDKVVKFAKVFTFAMAILSFSALFQDEYETAKLMFPLQAIVYILCIAIVLRSLNKNHNWAKYYVISWLPLLTGAGVGSLLMLGEIEHTFWTRHATMLGMLFEMSFISLALAERIRVNEAQRLYEATHDLETHLPNQNLLRQTCYELNSKDSNARYSLLSIRISNFSEIKDFIGGEKLAPFFHDFTRVVAHELASDLTLVPMNTEGNDQPTILLTEDTICFLIQSGDLALVNKALKNLLASEAGHFKYQSIPIQFNYYIGVTVPFSEAYLKLDKLVELSLEAVELAKRNRKKYAFIEKSQKLNIESRITTLAHLFENKSDFELISFKTLRPCNDLNSEFAVVSNQSSVNRYDLLELSQQLGCFYEYLELQLNFIQTNVKHASTCFIKLNASNFNKENFERLISIFDRRTFSKEVTLGVWIADVYNVPDFVILKKAIEKLKGLGIKIAIDFTRNDMSLNYEMLRDNIDLVLYEIGGNNNDIEIMSNTSFYCGKNAVIVFYSRNEITPNDLIWQRLTEGQAHYFFNWHEN